MSEKRITASTGSLTKWRWHLRRLLNQMWVRTSAFAVLGVVTAIAAWALKYFIPWEISAKIGGDAVEAILQILASSMLAVTTFSLSIMVQALASATNNATPRATALLLEDGGSQTVLATFIGAFLFSLIGIILLKTEVYGNSGRVVLFAVTLVVVLLVVVSLLRWISRLSRLGRISDTLDRAEAAADEALANRLASPWFGGRPHDGTLPEGLVPLTLESIGRVQHVDVAALSEAAEAARTDVYVTALPGDFADPTQPVLMTTRALTEDEAAALRSPWTVDRSRSFDQDPEFGLIVLSEIAQRALSPAVNDPGTANDVLGRIFRVLSQWREAADPEVIYPRLYLPSIRADQLLDRALHPIARDAAGVYEVQITLQQVLARLARLTPEVFAKAAAVQSQRAMTYARDALRIEAHLEVLTEASRRIDSIAAKHDSAARDRKT
ncbi:MAG: DUF2254 domain-containing protein [Paracoccus sp. (in: a-proteobacteria)]|nr:DUF2254 domain-containing protein [Paracoccus sp. (in: a-proteobacteria)]